MYDTRKVEALAAEFEVELETLLDKYGELMSKAVHDQIPKGNNLETGMGTLFIVNRKGKYVAEEFCNKLKNIFYYRRISIYLESIDKR